MTRQFARPIVVALAALIACATSAAAQAPAAGRLQYVIPPSTWRLTATGEVLPSVDVKATAQRAALYARDVGVSRLALRLSAPVLKRGQYRTVVANEFTVDRLAFSYGPTTPTLPTGVGSVARSTGPGTLQILQHDLLVSQGLGPKWRASGVLQHGFFTDGSTLATGAAYRAAGGAFLTRVSKPTLQFGGGVLALNVYPWVIPTIRILHVGTKWRTDMLLPRAESWYDVGHGVEVGGALRFLANRWWVDGEESRIGVTNITRTTFQQTTLGPAINKKFGTRGLVQLEGGAAVRRMLVEGTAPPTLASSVVLPYANRLDVGVGGYLRLSGRATF